MRTKAPAPLRVFRIRTRGGSGPERLTHVAKAVRRLVEEKLAVDELWSTAEVAKALGLARCSISIDPALDGYRVVRPGATTLYGKPATVRAYLASQNKTP